MKSINLFTLLLIILIINSCSKEESTGTIDISYMARISVTDTLIISDQILYKDILGYDTSNYTFLIDPSAKEKLSEYYFPSGGLPFSVNVSGVTVYSGEMFPMYSEVVPYGLIIDPYSAGNKLTVLRLFGYKDMIVIPWDQRNDERIISILRRDHKLMKIEL